MIVVQHVVLENILLVAVLHQTTQRALRVFRVNIKTKKVKRIVKRAQALMKYHHKTKSYVSLNVVRGVTTVVEPVPIA